MQCPTCGYQLSPFDKECPRCEHFKSKGSVPSIASQPIPEPKQEIPVFKTVEEKLPSPEQVVAEVPVIQTNLISTRSDDAQRTYLLIFLSVIVIILAVVFFNHTHNSSDEQTIINIAKQASCDHLQDVVGGVNCTSPNHMLDGCEPSIHYSDENDAEVTFRIPSGDVYDRIEVERDTNGEWHAK